MKRCASFLLLLLCSCSFNFSLLPPAGPYEEKVLEGEGRPKILLVDLTGVISFRERKGLARKEGSKVAGLAEALRKAEKDEDIAGVIIKINSPGGTVAASDTIHHEILRFKEKRKGVPVHAYIMEIGTSGAYYSAVAADRIVIHPAAITGSIGVLAVKLNVHGLMAKLGVQDETYKSGGMKDFWSPFRPSTAEGKAMVQGVMDRLHARFVDAVYAQRRSTMSRHGIEALADGRIFAADEALKAKLVDEIGYLDGAVEKMKKSLGIEQARVVTYGRSVSRVATIYSAAPSVDENSVGGQWDAVLDALDLLPVGEVAFMYLWNP
jgi:protease-4